ncbi:MAG: RNA polymerase sigma factor [Oscillospiraceae bacterium]
MIFYMVAETEAPREKPRQGKLDEALLARIGRDDRDALEELYLTTERAVYALVLSILKNPEMTQDVVQDTYLKIRAAAHLYQPRGKPLAWIFSIAKNLAFDALRQGSSCIAAEEPVGVDDLRYSCVSDPTDRLVLTAALDILEEDERQLVLLHAVSGITHQELAKTLGMPLSTVLSRYHRALKKLKKHLTERGAF